MGTTLANALSLKKTSMNSQDCSGWKGPQEVSAPTSRSQQAQL